MIISADAAMRERKEPAMPAPLLDVMRHPGALAYPSDLDVAIEDTPAFLLEVLFAAAGEGRHAV